MEEALGRWRPQRIGNGWERKRDSERSLGNFIAYNSSSFLHLLFCLILTVTLGSKVVFAHYTDSKSASTKSECLA